MAVRGSRTARPAQVREMARAAAAEVAAVELRVVTEAVESGARSRGWVIPGVDTFARIQSTFSAKSKLHRLAACVCKPGMQNRNREKINRLELRPQNAHAPRPPPCALMYFMSPHGRAS